MAAMTLNEYARTILKNTNCPEDAYAEEHWKAYAKPVINLAVQDLKEAGLDCPADGFSFEDVAAELVRIGNAAFIPHKKPAFKVLWGSSDCADSFHAGSLEEAKEMCIELLVQWIIDETEDWKYTPGKGFEPTDEQVFSYDGMIDDCSAWVVQLTDPDAEDEADQYSTVWEPSEDDLRNIRWVHWDELRKMN